MRKGRKGLKGYFITGLLVVVPLYITLYVLVLIVGFMDNALDILPGFLRPDTYLPVRVPGQGIVFTVLGILAVGVLTANFLGQKIMRLTDRVMAKVPIVSVVYNATKQLMETFLNKEHEGFRRVVLVQFPRQGAWSMGFVTGRAGGEIRARTSPEMLSLFIPTTPNPTSGFYIVTREEDVIALSMSVEDAFKVLMSGGMVVPPYDEVKNGAGAGAGKTGEGGGKKDAPE